jgi:hypothetical protein
LVGPSFAEKSVSLLIDAARARPPVGWLGSIVRPVPGTIRAARASMWGWCNESGSKAETLMNVSLRTHVRITLDMLGFDCLDAYLGDSVVIPSTIPTQPAH